MLTFEDFFKKKKIDLQQLQQAEPVLFAEFSKHYPLMGEKSFDHTKKYWFNNLRRSYPLALEIKPHAVKAEAISAMAVQGMAVAAAQNLNEAIERPKFKEDNLSELVEENVSVKEVSLAEEEKIINETNLVKSGEEKSEEREVTKPAFKPRFNMQNIKKDVIKEVLEAEARTSATEVEIKPEPAIENPQPKTEPAKPAFKPRFNMQNIKKDVVKEASETEAEGPKSEERVQAESEIEKPEPPTTEPTENKEAKPVYKPRFQMRNMPKTAAENPPPDTESE